MKREKQKGNVVNNKYCVIGCWANVQLAFMQKESESREVRGAEKASAMDKNIKNLDILYNTQSA